MNKCFSIFERKLKLGWSIIYDCNMLEGAIHSDGPIPIPILILMGCFFGIGCLVFMCALYCRSQERENVVEQQEKIKLLYRDRSGLTRPGLPL